MLPRQARSSFIRRGVRDIFTRSLSESYLNTGNKKIDSFVEPNIHAKHLDIADTGKEKPDINVAKHPAGIKKSRKLYLYQIFWLVMTLSFFASLFFSVGNYTTYQKETEEMSGNMADLKEGLGEKDPAHLIDSLKKIR
jgi:hypothetical protein